MPLIDRLLSPNGTEKRVPEPGEPSPSQRGIPSTALPRGALRTIAMLGNHVPRQCGITTFTTDLSAAIAAEDAAVECFVVAMNDTDQPYAYPPRVRFEIAEHDLASCLVPACGRFLERQRGRYPLREA